MNTFILCLSILLTSHHSAYSPVKCTGDDNCTACKSCKSCKFCKNGGTCGVCNGKKVARQYREGFCEEVVDGDTIVVVQDGKDVHVRLIGVDTPETKDPRKPIQAFGKEASAFTTKRLRGKKVTLKFDPHTNKVDRYGRMLAYVWEGNTLVNDETILS